MSKSIFLKVSGEGDYSALHFEHNFDKKHVYKEMLKNETKEATITFENEYGEEEIYLSIHVFESVDPEFVSFMKNHFIDYDASKAKDFHLMEVVE